MRTSVRDGAEVDVLAVQTGLRGRQMMMAWVAAELRKVPLADALELLLLASDLKPARFDRAFPRWHASGSAEPGT